MSLLLHCGAARVDYPQLAHLPVPAAMGSRHAVRPFIDDVDIVLDEFHNIGARVEDTAYGVLTKDGLPARFFGLIQVRLPNVTADEDFALMVGLRGSYDQSLSRAMAVGSRVFVCDNLAFSGEVQIRTKQTTYIDRRLPRLIAEAVERIPALAEAQNAKFEAYRNRAITRRDGDAMLVEMVRRGAMAPSQLGVAIAEWDKPSHPEHAGLGWSVWRLHNAITQAIKPSNPERAAVPMTWQRTQIMTRYLDDSVGLGGETLAKAA
jgi:hypothetical protein